jgi:hypothetical protein
MDANIDAGISQMTVSDVVSADTYLLELMNKSNFKPKTGALVNDSLRVL